MQGLIRLLSTCASGSAAAAESLLQLRISSILKDVLAGSGLISSTSVSSSSVNRPPEQACIYGAIGVDCACYVVKSVEAFGMLHIC